MHVCRETWTEVAGILVQGKLKALPVYDSSFQKLCVHLYTYMHAHSCLCVVSVFVFHFIFSLSRECPKVIFPTGFFMDTRGKSTDLKVLVKSIQDYAIVIKSN